MSKQSRKIYSVAKRILNLVAHAKKNLSIFQDVESIAQVTLQWKQRVRSLMKSARNVDINH